MKKTNTHWGSLVQKSKCRQSTNPFILSPIDTLYMDHHFGVQVTLTQITQVGSRVV